MRPKGNSAFNSGFIIDEIKESDWDLLLSNEKWTDQMVIEMIESGERKEEIAKLRLWVKLHYFNRFVPERVLEMFGMQIRRWGGE